MGHNKAVIVAAGGVLAVAFFLLTGCSMSRDLLDVRDGDRTTNPDAVTKDGRELVSFSWTQGHTMPDRCFSLYFYIEDEQPSISGYFIESASGKRLEAGTGADTDTAASKQAWQLNYVQWFELQNTLADTELPEYSEPESKSSASLDDTDSESVGNASADKDIDDSSTAFAVSTDQGIDGSSSGLAVSDNQGIDGSSTASAASADLGNTIYSKITIVWSKDGTEQTVILDGSNAEELESKVLSLAQQAHDAG